jgi:hypothetical protein
MMFALIFMKFDYATMAKYEMNAVENGDLFTVVDENAQLADAAEMGSDKGIVLDLVYHCVYGARVYVKALNNAAPEVLLVRAATVTLDVEGLTVLAGGIGHNSGVERFVFSGQEILSGGGLEYVITVKVYRIKKITALCVLVLSDGGNVNSGCGKCKCCNKEHTCDQKSQYFFHGFLPFLNYCNSVSPLTY